MLTKVSYEDFKVFSTTMTIAGNQVKVHSCYQGGYNLEITGPKGESELQPVPIYYSYSHKVDAEAKHSYLRFCKNVGTRMYYSSSLNEWVVQPMYTSSVSNFVCV